MPWPRGYKTCPLVHKQPIVALYLSLRLYSSFITSRPGLSPNVSDTLKNDNVPERFFMYLNHIKWELITHKCHLLIISANSLDPE